MHISIACVCVEVQSAFVQGPVGTKAVADVEAPPQTPKRSAGFRYESIPDIFKQLASKAGNAICLQDPNHKEAVDLTHTCAQRLMLPTCLRCSYTRAVQRHAALRIICNTTWTEICACYSGTDHERNVC